MPFFIFAILDAVSLMEWITWGQPRLHTFYGWNKKIAARKKCTMFIFRKKQLESKGHEKKTIATSFWKTGTNVISDFFAGYIPNIHTIHRSVLFRVLVCSRIHDYLIYLSLLIWWDCNKLCYELELKCKFDWISFEYVLLEKNAPGFLFMICSNSYFASIVNTVEFPLDLRHWKSMQKIY